MNSLVKMLEFEQEAKTRARMYCFAFASSFTLALGSCLLVTASNSASASRWKEACIYFGIFQLAFGSFCLIYIVFEKVLHKCSDYRVSGIPKLTKFASIQAGSSSIRHILAHPCKPANILRRKFKSCSRKYVRTSTPLRKMAAMSVIRTPSVNRHRCLQPHKNLCQMFKNDISNSSSDDTYETINESAINDSGHRILSSAISNPTYLDGSNLLKPKLTHQATFTRLNDVGRDFKSKVEKVRGLDELTDFKSTKNFYFTHGMSDPLYIPMNNGFPASKRNLSSNRAALDQCKNSKAHKNIYQQTLTSPSSDSIYLNMNGLRKARINNITYSDNRNFVKPNHSCERIVNDAKPTIHANKNSLLTPPRNRFYENLELYAANYF